MKTFFLTLFFSFLCVVGFSQRPETTKKGVIKIQKKGQLSKIIFDDVNYRLIGVDYYGNVIDTAVLGFQMHTTIKGIFYKDSTLGPTLSRNMQHIVERRDSKTTLYFKKIKAKDRNGTRVNMPDFSYTFPYSKSEDD